MRDAGCGMRDADADNDADADSDADSDADADTALMWMRVLVLMMMLMLMLMLMRMRMRMRMLFFFRSILTELLRRNSRVAPLLRCFLQHCTVTSVMLKQARQTARPPSGRRLGCQGACIAL